MGLTREEKQAKREKKNAIHENSANHLYLGWHFPTYLWLMVCFLKSTIYNLPSHAHCVAVRVCCATHSLSKRNVCVCVCVCVCGRIRPLSGAFIGGRVLCLVSFYFVLLGEFVLIVIIGCLGCHLAMSSYSFDT